MSASALNHAIARAASRASGASACRLIEVAGDELRVVASIGTDPSGEQGDFENARYVVQSGQPLALSPAAAPGGADAAAPLLCVPCVGEEGAVGALELRRDPGAESFGLDAMEVATLMGEVAAAAIASSAGAGQPPAPAELAADLAQLAAADPARYATVSSLVSALLGHG